MVFCRRRRRCRVARNKKPNEVVLTPAAVASQESPGRDRFAIEFGNIEDVFGRVVANVGRVLFIVVGIEEQLFMSVGMDIVDIAYPFAYDEITLAGQFYAVTAIGKIGDGAEIFVCIGQKDGFPGENIEAVFGGLETIGAG